MKYEVFARETVLYSVLIEADNENHAKELAEIYISEGRIESDNIQDFKIDYVYIEQ